MQIILDKLNEKRKMPDSSNTRGASTRQAYEAAVQALIVKNDLLGQFSGRKEVSGRKGTYTLKNYRRSVKLAATSRYSVDGDNAGFDITEPHVV